VLATASPDTLLPHTAAFVGDALGLHCGSFDLSAACAGFIYELVVGASLVQSGYDHVLIVGAETLSRITDPEDRGTVILFGDGAAAAVLSRSTGSPGLLAWDLGCDGSAAGLIEIPAGGGRLPASAETVADRGHYMKMQGQEVFRRAVRAIADSGPGVLLIDHDMSLVLGVCDVVHVLEFGKLIFSGTPAEARTDATVVAAYLGAPVEAGHG